MATAAFKAVMPVESRRIGSTPIHSRNAFSEFNLDNINTMSKPSFPVHSHHTFIKSGWLVYLLLTLVSCTHEIRVKNWINYPVELTRIETLDSLSIHPDVIKFSGEKISSARVFDEDVHIQGRQDSRPQWVGDAQGCLIVDGGARVSITDMNFKGNGGDEPLIQVKSGQLILENCDFKANETWAIQVHPGGSLEVRSVHFFAQGEGAIYMAGGQVRVFSSLFENMGKKAIQADGGDIFEIHNSIIRNTMGTGLEIYDVSEVWLDSLDIIDSFQDGAEINDCDYVLINSMESRENGRRGLSVSNARICGILNLSALGNLVTGIETSEVDTLRMLNSELVGNGQNGGLITNTLRTRMAGIRVGHNGGAGLRFLHGQELWLKNSSFQANPQTGLSIDSLKSIRLHQITAVNNDVGVRAEHFDSLKMDLGLLNANRKEAFILSQGIIAKIVKNLAKRNQSGLRFQDILHVELDSNRFEGNTLGSDIQATSNLKMSGNQWVSNTAGAFLAHIESMSSTSDLWRGNLDAGLEINSASEVLMKSARVVNNKKGILLNEVSMRMQASFIDSSREYGLKIMNSHAILEAASLKGNGTAIRLDEGSQMNITQSQLKNNVKGVEAEASTSMEISFSRIEQGQHGIQLGNFAEAKILSNHFDQISDVSVQISGPHVQTVLLRENLFTQNRAILDSDSRSGVVILQSNTFANNPNGFSARESSLAEVDHNIFFNTPEPDASILRDEGLFKWNCVYPIWTSSPESPWSQPNLFVDPSLGDGFHLLPDSPCLDGGDNGLLIGARGAVPVSKPALKP